VPNGNANTVSYLHIPMDKWAGRRHEQDTITCLNDYVCPGSERTNKGDELGHLPTCGPLQLMMPAHTQYTHTASSQIHAKRTTPGSRCKHTTHSTVHQHSKLLPKEAETQMAYVVLNKVGWI